MYKTDMQLKNDIEEELRWDPKVNAAQIGVSVDRGTVALLGAVDNYPQKWAAEDAAKRVSGVRTVAQALTVKVPEDHMRSDPEIAAAVQNALRWNVLVPEEVTAQVERGTVTLEGAVAWNYERDAAEGAIRYLRGVVNVSNRITLAPHESTPKVKENLEAALQRHAAADGKSIHVASEGNKVTLSSYASSWSSIEDARDAAWASPGVTQVIDEVRISLAP